MEAAQWTHLMSVKADFASADYVGNNRIVFDIKGNDYRLVAVVLFVAGTVFIRWVGTHSEYDKINVKTI